MVLQAKYIKPGYIQDDPQEEKIPLPLELGKEYKYEFMSNSLVQISIEDQFLFIDRKQIVKSTAVRIDYDFKRTIQKRDRGESDFTLSLSSL